MVSAALAPSGAAATSAAIAKPCPNRIPDLPPFGSPQRNPAVRQKSGFSRTAGLRCGEPNGGRSGMRLGQGLAIAALVAAAPLGAKAADTIKIGFPIPLSGPTA